MSEESASLSLDGKQAEDENKQRNDFSDVIKEKIPEFTALVKPGNVESLQVAVANLLDLERQTRLAVDLTSTNTLAITIINLIHESRQWKMLNEHITLLCKRRAQMSKVIGTVIKGAIPFLDDTPDEATKRELIETLRAVSAGKIFVELERARLTKLLTDMMEKEGKQAEAAEILQEVQVETIGAMDLREKCNLLLEQVRLCLWTKDFVRGEIIAKKVNTEVISKADFQDEKLKFYELMIILRTHQEDYLQTCKAYHAIFNTPKVQADAERWQEALRKAALFSVLAPLDSDSSDVLHRIREDPKLKNQPYKVLLDEFTTDELIPWPFRYEEVVRNDSTFSEMDKGEKRWLDLHRRVIEHNIRVVAGYYKRISTQRLATLLQLDLDRTEESLSEMVCSKQLTAKIDRPTGVVTFGKKQTPDDILNNWSNDIGSLLALIDNTCHLISKEQMRKDS